MRLPFFRKPAPLPAAPTVGFSWDAALNHLHRVRAMWNIHLKAQFAFEHQHPDDWNGHPEHRRLSEVSNDWCDADAAAIRALIAVPTASISDALLKLEIAIEFEENTGAAIADLRRLTGIAGPTLSVLEQV